MTLVTQVTRFVFKHYVLISEPGTRTIFYSIKKRPFSFPSQGEAETRAEELRTAGNQHARVFTQKELQVTGGQTMK